MVTDNKFDFYNITDIADKKYKILDKALKHIIVQRVFHNTSIGPFLDKRDMTKYKSKLLIITGDFFLSDPQITKQDKDWLYPQLFKQSKKLL